MHLALHVKLKSVKNGYCTVFNVEVLFIYECFLYCLLAQISLRISNTQAVFSQYKVIEQLLLDRALALAYLLCMLCCFTSELSVLYALMFSMSLTSNVIFSH